MTSQTKDNWGIIGHEEVMSFFEQSLRRGRPAHAYLLVGQGGLGKTTIAEEFAKRLLVTERLETHANYLKVERGNDPKTGKLRDQIAIGQVHELRGVLARTAMGGGAKVAVLVGADRLGREAANALLKTLEEPSGDTVLILTAEYPDNVLPTVSSRCQVVRLSSFATANVADSLIGRGVPADQALTLAAISGGRPGVALRLYEDAELYKELLARRRDWLSLPDLRVSQRWALVEAWLPKKLSFNESGDRAREHLNLAAELLRDAVLIGQGLGDKVTHLDVSAGVEAWLSSMGSRRIITALDALPVAHARLNANVSPRSTLEDFTLLFERNN